MKRFYRYKSAALAAVVVAAAPLAARADDPVLPAIGLNFQGMITEMGTKIGTNMGLAFGMGLVVTISFATYTWLKRAARGR
jgi:uncharacterized protein (DUF697 family)